MAREVVGKQPKSTAMRIPVHFGADSGGFSTEDCRLAELRTELQEMQPHLVLNRKECLPVSRSGPLPAMVGVPQLTDAQLSSQQMRHVAVRVNFRLITSLKKHVLTRAIDVIANTLRGIRHSMLLRYRSIFSRSVRPYPNSAVLSPPDSIRALRLFRGLCLQTLKSRMRPCRR